MAADWQLRAGPGSDGPGLKERGTDTSRLLVPIGLWVKIGVPPNHWFIMGIPTEMVVIGGTLF